MRAYQSKYGLLAGTSYDEAIKVARREYRRIQALTKRQPYVRSKYFAGDKVFVNLFFTHLMQKRKGEQIKRAKLLLCAIDLLRHSTNTPDTVIKNENPNDMLHRFMGVTKEGQVFFVQVKQNKRTGRKDFMSAFPAKKQQ